MRQIRILLTGPDWCGDLLPYCRRACERLGLEVRTLAINDPDWQARALRPERLIGRVPVLGEKIAFRLRRTTRRRLNDHVNRQVESVIREFRPNLLLALISWKDPIRQDVLARAVGAVKVGWLMDNPFLDDETVLPSLGGYDRLYAVDEAWLTSLRFWVSCPVAALPCGACAESFRPKSGPRDKVVFVGSSYGTLSVGLIRQRLLRPLTDLGLTIYGDPGWRSVPGLDRCYAGGPIGADEANDVYNRAAIVVNVHHTQWYSGTSLRTFSIAAAGAFQLVDWRPGLDLLFEPGREIVTYRTGDELLELVKRYLTDETARVRIAAAGRKRVLREHTYIHRIRQILDDCGFSVSDSGATAQ